jgi:hypothetical protein
MLAHCRSVERSSVGAWRSLVAHLHGVQGVPSSNLGAPTNFFNDLRTFAILCRLTSLMSPA